MANYDDFKKKAKDAIDTIADVSVEAFRIAEEKARVLAKRAKLSAGITHEKAVVRRLKMEIGHTYYKLFKDSPAEDFKQYCEDITSAFERIAAKQRELEELKNCSTCDAGDEEYEDLQEEDSDDSDDSDEEIE